MPSEKRLATMGSSKVSMKIGDDKVAIVTINNPPVNSLANAVYNGLYKAFKEAQEDDGIKAVVITGANGMFCGGADIRSFQRRQNAEEEAEIATLSPFMIINKVIEACRKPVVAAVEGFALGGGLELAMACHARVAAKGTQLGLPELQLGIIPGLGGTQRLPRLVGLEKALEMLLTSRSLGAEEARDFGLVDAVTDVSTLLYTARSQALKMVSSKESWHASLYRIDKIGNIEEALTTIETARASARQKFRNVNYPFLCLDIMEEGLRKGGDIGTELESKTSRALVKTFEARALMHIFFAQRSSYKVPGLTNLGLRGRPIKRAAIIGCGLMGSGIATALVSHKVPVILKDVDLVHARSGIEIIKGNLDSFVKSGKMTELQARDSLGLVSTADDYSDFGSLDLVIESVPEEVCLKQHLFQELENACSASCIFASNTSSIDISTIGANISHPDRIVGAHFFSPAHIMRLLEIVQTDQTSSQTVVDLLLLTKTLKKVPVVVRNTPGFAANRLFVPYLMISTFLVDVGLDPYRIDVAVKEFGMPMGPFRIADITGINTFQLVSQTFSKSYPESFYKSPLIALLLKDNRFGKSTKMGFYDYRVSRKGATTQDLEKYVEKSRQIAGVNGAHTTIHDITDAELIEMIFLGVANEACKVLEDNVVAGPEALDLASVLGMSFPAYRGGIIFWANSLGPVYIRDKLKTWWQRYGNVYKPSSYLEACAASGEPLGKVSKNPSKL